MRTRLFLIASFGLTLLFMATPARAIVYGEPDGTRLDTAKAQNFIKPFLD